MEEAETLEGYEEVSLDSKGESSEGKTEFKKGAGNRPDFRVVQPDKDMNGNSTFRSVGAMWKQKSKSGNDFYVMKIGELRLLVFSNDQQR